MLRGEAQPSGGKLGEVKGQGEVGEVEGSGGKLRAKGGS